MYLLKNGKIVKENEILEGYDLVIHEDKILKIEKAGVLKEEDYEVIDGNGGYITPGFIDIHSDYIENIASPRPTSVMDFQIALREAEKVLINNGITTMYHSLSFYGKDAFEVKSIRKSENVSRLINIISNAHEELHLIRHRFHARFEIDNIKGIEEVKSYIRAGKVNLLSIMDHSPGQGQYRDLQVFMNTLKAYRGLSEEELDKAVCEAMNKDKLTLKEIKELIDLAKKKGIAVASHDDDTIEKINLIKNLGATISEFPITLEVAKKAKEEGLVTVAGAPNVLLGGSHSGNLSAAKAITEGVVDVLCSDYYPAAMLHSIFILNEKYNMPLHKMFNLVTINPARAVKIDRVVGSIEEGKKGDLLIIEKIEGHIPVITKVFVDGKLVTNTNYRM